MSTTQHGTYAGWSWHDRHNVPACDACREAKREYVRAQRAASLAAGRLTHGRRSTFDAGCRCGQCRAVRQVAYVTNPGEYQPKGKRRLVPRDPVAP